MTPNPPTHSTAVSAKLSIIIVNWNSKDFLRKCLTSIRDSGLMAPEIVVVDNASFDGAGEILAAEFPPVKFVQADQNLGFARANNLGFSLCAGDVVLFLNPDTEVAGAALQTMLAATCSLPDAGIIGARLLNTDGTLQTDCVRAFPTLLNQLLDSHFLKLKFPRASLWGMRALFEKDSSAPSAVDAVSGAAMMMRREVFEQAGRFNTAYFMYSEDVELCWRALQHGHHNYYVPAAHIVHHGGKSSALSQQSDFAAILIRESRFRLLRTMRGWGPALLFRGITLLAAGVRLLLLLFLLVGTVGLFHTRRLLGTIRKWGKVASWALGLESWATTLSKSGKAQTASR